MIDLKYCVNCYNNYYNPNCWSRKTGKIEWQMIIRVDERPPYKHKLKRVPSCWHGNNQTTAIRTEVLTADGYWKP